MLAGTDDHLTWLSPVILNLESTGLTHLESEIRVAGAQTRVIDGRCVGLLSGVEIPFLDNSNSNSY